MQIVLTIAGFDPSSGAGISADLKVFAAHGLYGTACITALTVQNTLGVAATQAVATDTVIQTLRNLQADLPPTGIKIGMLANASIVSAVASFLREIGAPGRIPVVLDPVLKSSSGKDLLDPEGVACLRDELLPLVDWVTPNVDEAAHLVGKNHLETSDLPQAARTIQNFGKHLNVLLTCGHLMPPNDLLLLVDGTEHSFEGRHIRSSATHGTGCAFSSAVLSGLLKGEPPVRAVAAAKRYVATGIRLAETVGQGRGPLALLWPLQDERRRDGPCC